MPQAECAGYRQGDRKGWAVRSARRANQAKLEDFDKGRNPARQCFSPLAGTELALRPFFAGSIVTLRSEIDPACRTISAASTPRNVQLANRTSSITAPSKPATHMTR